MRKYLLVLSMGITSPLLGQVVIDNVPTDRNVAVQPIPQSPTPDRTLLDVISNQPGWIYESNGVLHPRESEYQTQFILDGQTRTDNLSPSFTFSPSDLDVRSIKVYTSGIPAEYGRSLGGVVVVDHAKNNSYGFHGDLNLGLANYDIKSLNEQNGRVALDYNNVKNEVDFRAEGYNSSHYLDPATFSNLHNHGTSSQIGLDDYYLGSNKDIQSHFSHSVVNFDVPNEDVQQLVGQNQRRHNEEYSFSTKLYTNITNKTLSTSFGYVNLNSILKSNDFSTPIIADQNRGFNQFTGSVTYSGYTMHNNWTVGADVLTRDVHEQFSYRITDTSQFDSDIRNHFQFNQANWDVEPAVYAQNTYTNKSWTVSTGIRYDHYDFVTAAQSLSPRVTVSKSISPKFKVHAYYDRVFQAPPIENILLASNSKAIEISNNTTQNPIRSGSANYYELGFHFQTTPHLSLDINEYVRHWHNYYDDNLLLNTGISFPFNDRAARIHGTEASIKYVNTHATGYVNYTNQNGTAYGPIVGGLLLGTSAQVSSLNTSSFPISQDQRNTIRSNFTWLPNNIVRLAVFEQYNSGLPTDLDKDITYPVLQTQYSQAVLSQVNFNRDRVKPWARLDASANFRIWHGFYKEMDLNLSCTNLLNKQYVINFAGLFSGTGTGVARTSGAKLEYRF